MNPIAVVTGGTGALGAAVAQSLHDAGYDVHVTAHPHHAPPSFNGPGHLSLVDLADFRATLLWGENLPGPVHAAALIAGGFDMQPLHECAEHHFDHLFDMNARSATNSLRALAPKMFEAKRSSVVLVGARVMEGAPGMALYGASKAAVINLTKSAAKEWADRGVRVNAILPDIIDTPANRAAMPGADFEKWAKPGEVASVIRFLCSDAASIVTGNTIYVNR